MEPLKRIVRFYLGWRLPVVGVVAAAFAVAFLSDDWWAVIVGLLGVAGLLALVALSAERVGRHEDRLADHDVRLGAAESRLGHAEDRDGSFERQIDHAKKRLTAVERQAKKASAEAIKAQAFAAPSAEPKGGSATRPANAHVVTGQIMSLYRIATGTDVESSAALVTIVVPCFNESRFIGDAIESLKAQTFANFSAIIVDDASTDDSVARAFAAIGGDDRFTVVRHAVNSGLSASRNTGLRLADTPFVCFLDGDDFFHVDNLEERVRNLIGYHDRPEIVGVYSGIEHVNEHVRFGDVGPSEPAGHRLRHADHLSAAGACPFNCHAPLLRTDIAQHLGGFDETMRHGAEDWEFWQRLMRHGYGFIATPSVLAVYRQKAASMVRSMPGQHLSEAERLLAAVHERLPADQVVPGTPYVFDRELGHYQQQLQLIERSLQFMGMAYMTGDDAQLDAAIDKIDPGLWPAAMRNMNVSALLDSGIRRGYSLDPEGFRHLNGKIAPIREVLFDRLSAHAGTAETPVAEIEAPLADIVFVPETAAQARHMVEVAAALPDEVTAIFVDPNMVSGSSGVGGVLADRWTGTRLSINEWALGRRSACVMVAEWPYGPTTVDLLRNASDAGASTVELHGAANAIVRLDDAHDHRCEHAVSDAAGLLDVIGSAEPGRLPVAYPRDHAALAAVEEYPRLPADIVDLAAFENRHVGERCVIIGNGPSLNDLDLGRLRTENTIGVNGIFYAEAIDYPLTYYVVEDTSVMEENLEAIKAYRAGHKFFPTIYRSMYGDLDVEEGTDGGVTYFTMNRGFYAKESPNFCIPRFSTDASQRLYCGQSVTIINLQLAYYMGFSEVYLIGMDFSYTIPDSAEVRGDLITSTEDDPNHFHKDYFGKGKTWKDPKLDRVLNNYQMAKAMYEADGRTIYNATAGGKLELFERRDFHDVFPPV